MWQESPQRCYRSACQISERLEKSKPESRGFETSRYLRIRRPSALPEANTLMHYRDQKRIAKFDWSLPSAKLIDVSKKMAGRLAIEHERVLTYHIYVSYLTYQQPQQQHLILPTQTLLYSSQKQNKICSVIYQNLINCIESTHYWYLFSRNCIVFWFVLALVKNKRAFLHDC